ncbi:ATP-binding protein [Aestuariibaculum marinum]|uniref:histidine kinase n=1 Tax=Aestuariibaculum marinum TaxID=2683592 RepID=A0A8J6PX10_9FLAO|nr:ATP-binding protein [Aestuariibaculum marinum]MBD0824498.1 response regulator [Aestuariibaculum marinum]
MRFVPSKKPVRLKTAISSIILAFIAGVIFLGYCFIEQKLPVKTTVLLLFGMVVIQILLLQYFHKNELKNRAKRKHSKVLIDDLKQKLTQANREADFSAEYLANISYELRTPLSTVLGMMDMLKKTDLDESQHAKLEIANISSKYMHQLVNMFSSNYEVNSSDIVLNEVAFNLNAELTSLLKVFDYQAWEKGLTFDYQFLKSEDSKFSLIGDSLRIQQVLINLVNNAIKFTNKGEISIIVDQTIAIGDEQIVTFYVKDTGVGMPTDMVKQIFNSSKKESTVLRKEYRGGGLGLSTCHKLVKLMGGELKIETQENEGTTFYFSLQLKKTLNVKVDTKAIKPLLTKKRNVLVAEDSRMNRRVLKYLLEQQGVDCTFAKNGIEAVELYKILDFDLIFMDLYMPDLDGFEATKAIKNTKKYKTNETPIIAVSASDFKEDKLKVKAFGLDAFLSKPIDIYKLKDILVKYLLAEKRVS